MFFSFWWVSKHKAEIVLKSWCTAGILDFCSLLFHTYQGKFNHRDHITCVCNTHGKNQITNRLLHSFKGTLYHAGYRMRLKVGYRWGLCSWQSLHRRWGHWVCHLMASYCSKRSFNHPPCSFWMGKQTKAVRSSLAAAVHLLDSARLVIQDVVLLWHGEVVAIAVCNTAGAAEGELGRREGQRCRREGWAGREEVWGRLSLLKQGFERWYSWREGVEEKPKHEGKSAKWAGKEEEYEGGE